VSHESNQASKYPTKADQTKAHGRRRGRGHRGPVGRLQFEFQTGLDRDYGVYHPDSVRDLGYHRCAFRDAQSEW
jgi:hypothetical protein